MINDSRRSWKLQAQLLEFLFTASLFVSYQFYALVLNINNRHEYKWQHHFYMTKECMGYLNSQNTPINKFGHNY